MIRLIYPYKRVSSWFTEWSAKSQPRLIRHMCLGLVYKKNNLAHVWFIYGKAILYIEGGEHIKVFPKFKQYSSFVSWFKEIFK